MRITSERLKELERRLPPGARITPQGDQTRLIVWLDNERLSTLLYPDGVDWKAVAEKLADELSATECPLDRYGWRHPATCKQACLAGDRCWVAWAIEQAEACPPGREGGDGD